MASLVCRSCASPLTHVFVDLGTSPLANSYLEPAALLAAETYLPLCVYVCERCWLVQLPEAERPQEIFSDYAYFSSFSESWLLHAERYVEMACGRFRLGPTASVVEVASNDGYLLQYFQARGVPVLGVEPAANVAAAAEAKGIPTVVRFFGRETARALAAEGRRADLLIGNNVLAHVPDLNDFVAGLAALLAPQGTITLEFPHLLRLMAENQFDTIYHEHYSYFSLLALGPVFDRHGLAVADVEELPTHGGSLRLFVQHAGAAAPGPAVAALLAREEAAGLGSLAAYQGYGRQVEKVKRDLLRFLLAAQEAGKTVVGYGAPAKGNTLLNYCGVRADLLAYTVDLSPHKQGHFLPGVRLPIHGPDRIRADRPDYVLILPWNLKDEIARQMADVRSWGGRFVVAVPALEVLA